MTEKELLNDEEFIQIQRLNSNNNHKRHSIVYDKPIYASVTTDELAEETEESAEPAKLEQVSDELLISFLKNLSILEKSRYRNDSITSFFGDVDFDNRPTIIDGQLNHPYISSFNGPVVERQMRALERSKRQLKAKTTEEKVDDVLATSGTDPLYKTQFVSNFSGVYVMLWMIIGLIAIRSVVDNYLDNNDLFNDALILRFMLQRLPTVAFLDMVMYFATYFVVLVHYGCKLNLFTWHKVGFWLVSIFELGYVPFFMYLIGHVLNLNWITRIFFFLHSVVLLMKMHSFAFFNGYLWNITKELNYAKRALAKYRDIDKPDVLETLKKSKNFCEYELASQASDTIKFPENITIKNYFMYTLFPVLVYQFDYPRTNKVRWGYVFERLAAIFGTILIMILDVQVFILPPAVRAMNLIESEYQWPSGLAKFADYMRLIVDFFPAMTVLYMLTFYLIWDAILNCVAELTYFADRYFYGDWWNCVSWAEFSRIWNVPVHKFLLRHVYHASISKWKLNKLQATMFTFILSSIFHELSMISIFKKFRPYLFLFQMSQLPMTFVSTTSFFKKRPVLNNVLFWTGVCSGPSVIMALYLLY
ncbi:hypothetical protein KAFR_0J02490 [Kazachstania africana CBS 2517]|uniref:O-acyltransferase n=1 Tax=Kazachstania africana (strain ATCC 22294 / BCRC 22015 / CBS 2517 / CECT 1963 / NBRC 1671 / NRRL Y-8276) TaxID=1071382 RepID=H2B113_KAZAF|nr:hypothetical protein KAFR_0J02490 [Kazachstania africana CBS 2517]CCF60313.1 hypothetical protein KAFR_0J02490 [Kazachstania africana CBS 2517]